MTNGYKLYELRTKRGISQMEMAEKLNTTQPQYSKYERGIQDITGQRIIEICKILDVTPNDLLGFEN